MPGPTIDSVRQITIADGEFMDATLTREAQIGEQVKEHLAERGITDPVKRPQELAELAGISHSQAIQVLENTTSARPDSYASVFDALEMTEARALASLNSKS